MTIVNLTKNTINVYAGEAFKAIPSSGEARIKSTRVFIRSVNGIPLYRKQYQTVIGLPPKTENTIFVVSAIVASLVPERDDVFIVDGVVRDDITGKVIGCRGLVHIDY